MPKPAHSPTPDVREKVRALAGYGVPHEGIALIVGVSEKTLRRHYRDDLDIGKATATAKVAQTLFNRAVSGNDLGATIFWLKAQAGWREVQKHEHEHSGKVTLEALVNGSLKPAD